MASFEDVNSDGQYQRDENKNTPEYWDKAWSGKIGSGKSSAHVAKRVAEMIDKLPSARVVELNTDAPLIASGSTWPWDSLTRA